MLKPYPITVWYSLNYWRVLHKPSSSEQMNLNVGDSRTIGITEYVINFLGDIMAIC